MSYLNKLSYDAMNSVALSNAYKSMSGEKNKYASKFEKIADCIFGLISKRYATERKKLTDNIKANLLNVAIHVSDLEGKDLQFDQDLKRALLISYKTRPLIVKQDKETFAIPPRLYTNELKSKPLFAKLEAEQNGTSISSEIFDLSTPDVVRPRTTKIQNEPAYVKKDLISFDDEVENEKEKEKEKEVSFDFYDEPEIRNIDQKRPGDLPREKIFYNHPLGDQELRMMTLGNSFPME